MKGTNKYEEFLGVQFQVKPTEDIWIHYTTPWFSSWELEKDKTPEEVMCIKSDDEAELQRQDLGFLPVKKNPKETESMQQTEVPQPQASHVHTFITEHTHTNFYKVILMHTLI